jgi:UDP-N-acetylglucosamine 2-epimerase
MKIMTVVGTRPEIIKLSRVIAELDIHTDHTLVHTGQNYDYELNEIFFEGMDIRKPDYFLNCAGSNPSVTIGNVIIRTDKLLAKVNPDAFLIYGDTNSCMSVIPAKRRRIPVFHMEAGNRCFDQRVPEEINRKIVDHLSDINMPLSEHARRYLIAEGIKPETIMVTGSPMAEVFKYHRESIDNSDILKRENLSKEGYFILSAHREENLDSEENFGNLLDSIEGIVEAFKMPVIVSTHPRTRKKMEAIGYASENSLIRFSKPFAFADYVNLELNSYCAISDSGTITEESSILGFPAITIRQAHERPEGMDEGTLIMSDLKRDKIIEAIKVVTIQNRKYSWRPDIIRDYQTENVSKKVVRIIISYTDYVNRTVWHK